MNSRVKLEVLLPLRRYTGGQKIIESKGSTVRELIEDVSERFPEFKEQLFGSSKELRDFIIILVNNKDVRNLDGLGTEVKQGDRVLLMSAIGAG
jgi:molybdopterin synthase sulfur carrier subunit